MKKLLFIGMMCVMSVGAFANTGSSINLLNRCVVHYSVVDNEGRTVWAQDVEADTCEHALTVARYWYSMSTQDYSVYH